MPLSLADKIDFNTESGPKSIELLFGDITLLPVSEKVDLLMVSAFQGDYTPTKTCLIGALYRQLSLEVGELANDKEEDLRKLFHCWWSKPLPENIPFRRILCFESSRSGVSPQKAVQAVFRALVPAAGLFTNGILMSPLLSTGNQGYSERAMLCAIINSAVAWMKNGLNINIYKLVIYGQHGKSKILKAFQKLKANHSNAGSLDGLQSMNGRGPPSVLSSAAQKYHFYLSYVSVDKENVEKVKQIFLQHQKEIKFFTSEELTKKSPDEANEEERIFNKMKTCSRVITFLSPAYLEDDDRVEEYNAAWCLNRQSSSFTRLAPMLCEAISNLPTYMSLVQWVDIRLRNGNVEKMIRNITLYVVGYVQGAEDGEESALLKTASAAAVEPDTGCKTVQQTPVSKAYEYDVFISYSHANEDTCKLVLKMLETAVLGIRIFVDRKELHTGGSWQQKLYHAVESSHMTIALLSQAYFNSKMCNEEFRLSLARHFTEKDYHLIPLQIEQLSDVEDRYLSVPNSILGDQDIRSCVQHQLAPAVKVYLSDGKADGSFMPLNKTVYNLHTLLMDGRSARLPDLIKNENILDVKEADDRRIHIMCAHNKNASDIGLRIKRRLTQQTEFKVELSSEYEDMATMLNKLDEADMIVVLISPQFLINDDLIEGLQVAINRERFDKRVRMYPVLLSDLSEVAEKHYHTYCDLLTYELCLTDPVWENIAIDEVMEEHPNYKQMMKEWRELHSMSQQLSEGDATEAGTKLMHSERDRALIQMKFVTAVCNRIIFYTNQTVSPRNKDVIVDIFSIIKEVVIDTESLEKQKQEMITKIGHSYKDSEKGNQSAIAVKVEPKSKRETISNQRKTSRACILS